jgi:hypothetical protein
MYPTWVFNFYFINLRILRYLHDTNPDLKENIHMLLYFTNMDPVQSKTIQ